MLRKLRKRRRAGWELSRNRRPLPRYDARNDPGSDGRGGNNRGGPPRAGYKSLKAFQARSTRGAYFLIAQRDFIYLIGRLAD